MKNIEKNDIWLNYTNSDKTVDFSGAEISLNEYGNKKKYDGWDVDHILPHSYSFINKIENLQPVNIETNKQKGNRTVGKIIHYYRNQYNQEFHIKTIFRIKKNSKIFDKEKINYGIVYIDRQDVFIDNNWYNIIKNIYYKDSQAWYYDGNKWHYSKLDVNKSLRLSCLCFEDENEPTKWKII